MKHLYNLTNCLAYFDVTVIPDLVVQGKMKGKVECAFWSTRQLCQERNRTQTVIPNGKIKGREKQRCASLTPNQQDVDQDDNQSIKLASLPGAVIQDNKLDEQDVDQDYVREVSDNDWDADHSGDGEEVK